MPLVFATAALGTEKMLFTVLVQLALIIVTARAFAVLFRWMKQPAVVGEIAAGIILGPSLFGHFFPELSAAIFQPSVNQVFAILSQLGLILLLFVVGLEFDFSHLRAHCRSAMGISLAGILLPFALGLLLAWAMRPYLEPVAGGRPSPFMGFALFMGTAMSITAIPVLGRIMIELDITRTRIGAITIAAAAVDDACGWILLATVTGIVQADFDPWGTVRLVALTVGFAVVVMFVVRPAMLGYLARALDQGRGELGPNHLTVVYTVLFLCALATNVIGIFAIFGAFVLGAALSKEPRLREVMSRHLRNFLTVILLPIFFTYTGLRTDIGSLHSPVHWLLLLGVCGAAILGKLGGCALAARWSGFSTREAACVGVMMNARALMELIVLNVGKDLGVLPNSVFCMLVLMALLTTVMTTPLLLWAMKGTELEPCIRGSGFLRPTATDPAAGPTVTPALTVTERS